MVYLILTTLSLILAVAVNSTSVYLQKHKLFYDKFERGLLVHGLTITPFWVLFALLLSGLNGTYKIDIPEYLGVGYLSVIIAIGLFVVSIRQLGLGALVNANFFKKNSIKPVSLGIYKLFKDPIYDSYFLLFIGLGFAMSNAAFFIIATISFIGLNIIESKVERIE